ncbi:hypothetical protein Hypma_007448 [Hypsizygus marmoreus]|uniref:TM7S3/TM198-like domain-containing protein n=1 Tax=Hypsizygus marmoreus TaxID=39966 RepID=A0A369JR07_HYPMA|nr:hypothetical protein Hypma_007448 [Hypsizygus marmoreus]
MAAAQDRQRLLFWILFIGLLTTALASPIVISPIPQTSLVPRSKFVFKNATGVPQVFNPETLQPIPQGPATDGGGTNFNPAALMWLAFSFAIGTPMALAGVRGWRLTTGVGIGLSATVCSWAAFINSVSDTGVPDALLSAIVLGFFFLGFILGLFEIGRIAGMAGLGVTGGLAFGIRIIILREGLLIPWESGFAADWVLIAFFGLVGAVAMVWQRAQRAGIVFGSASVGTFLVFLGVDLIINRQTGMSRGLRFLFDRNASHALDILVRGYTPPLSTQILLGVSLALTPILAYAQHRVFAHSFSRKPRPDSELASDAIPTFLEKNHLTKRQASISRIWDGAKFKGTNRFSL